MILLDAWISASIKVPWGLTWEEFLGKGLLTVIIDLFPNNIHMFIHIWTNICIIVDKYIYNKLLGEVYLPQ